MVTLPYNQKYVLKRTCQDNIYPRNSPLMSLLLLQTGTDFAQTSRTACIPDMLVIFSF